MVVPVPPFGDDNTGGGDPQFDAIVNFMLTDSDNDHYYDRVLRTQYHAIGHQLCATYENGYDVAAGMKIGEENKLNIAHYSAVEAAAIYAYRPEKMDKMRQATRKFLGQ